MMEKVCGCMMMQTDTACVADDDKVKRRRLAPHQLQLLESHFAKDIYPSTQLKEDLAAQLGKVCTTAIAPSDCFPQV